MQDVEQKVLEIIARTIGSESNALGSATFDELELSSLDAVSIAYELEQEFQIKIPDDQVYTVKSVKELVAGIQKLVCVS